MSEPFLITGLPRSRTAWMAAAAMNDQSLCFHEPLRSMERWEDVIAAFWQGDHARYLGVSDHALGFHLEAIMRRVTPRTLIIERPIAEVNASLARLGLPASNFCDVLLKRLAYDHPSIMRVPYAELASWTVVARCLRHLMPEALINLDRLEDLQRLNIQAHEMTKVIAHGMRRGAAGDAASLLGASVVAELRFT